MALVGPDKALIAASNEITGGGGISVLSLQKLDAAVLFDRGLFEPVHLSFEPSELGSVSSVPSDEERCRPEHDDCDTGDDGIFGGLAVLNAGRFGSTS
jgi:hypothetical protein